MKTQKSKTMEIFFICLATIERKSMKVKGEDFYECANIVKSFYPNCVIDTSTRIAVM